MKTNTIIILASLLLVSLISEGRSKDEIKSIVSAYSDAWEEHDLSAMTNLFHSTVDLDAAGIKRFNSYKIKQVTIRDIEDQYVKIRITFANGPEKEDWLYLLDDGKIKYDPLLVPHPISSAFTFLFQCLHRVHNPDDISRREVDEKAFESLLNVGIPVFDVDKVRFDEREEKLQEILEWLVDNGSDWDSTEPKIPCQEDVFREFAKRARNYD